MFLNALNVVQQQCDIAEAIDSDPDIDLTTQRYTLDYSIAWFVNATADLFAGAKYELLKDKGVLLDKSLSDIRSIQGAEMSQLAKAYVNRSLTIAMAGCLAAAMEGWQTLQAARNADSMLEKGVLYAKSLTLGGQVLVWGDQSLRVLRSYRADISLETLFEESAADALFWFCIPYLILGLLLNFMQRSPIETWLRESIWGKSPKGQNAAKEYQALLQVVSKPSIQTKVIESVTDISQDIPAYAPIPVHITLALLLCFPQLRAGQTVGIAIRVSRQKEEQEAYWSFDPNAESEAKPRKLTEQEIQSGTWSIDDQKNATFSLSLPFTIAPTDRVEVFASTVQSNPFAQEHKSHLFYQSRLKPVTMDDSIEMLDLVKLDLRNNNFVPFKAPEL